MPAQNPQDLHPLFARAFNAGDPDALIALYEPGATLVPTPGQPVTGAGLIRTALNGLLGLKGTIALETRGVLLAGDVALLHAQWTLTGTMPNGSPLEMAGRSNEVARRQPDGSWLYVIDDPFGEV
jgi:uncharacterized protein (TIGR02246 family)